MAEVHSIAFDRVSTVCIIRDIQKRRVSLFASENGIPEERGQGLLLRRSLHTEKKRKRSIQNNLLTRRLWSKKGQFFRAHFFNTFDKILRTKMYSTKNALFDDDDDD